MPKAARRLWALFLLAVALSPVALEAQGLLQGYGAGPLGLAVTRDGRTAYVACNLDDLLLVIDLQAMRITDSIDVSSVGPMLGSSQAALALDDRKLYVYNHSMRTVMVFDTVSKRVIKVLPIAALSNSAFSRSADGTRVYIAAETGALCVIDARDDSFRVVSVPGVVFGTMAPKTANPLVLAVVGAVSAGPGTMQPAFFEFDLATETVMRSAPLPADVLPPGKSARRLILSPDATRAYFGWMTNIEGASDRGTGNFVVFDLAGFRVLSSAAVDNGVADLAVNSASGKAYLIGFWSGGASAMDLPVHEWDIVQNRLIRDIDLPPSSDQRAIVLDPSNPGLVIMTEGDQEYLAKIDAAAGRVTGTVPFIHPEIWPRLMFREGDTGYVFCQSGTTAYKLDLRTGDYAGAVLLPAQSRAVGFHNGLLYARASGNTVAMIDPADSAVVGTFDLGTSLNAISLHFSGTKIAAVDYASGMTGKRLLIFDGDPPRLQRSIDLPSESTANIVVFSPDGSKIYVTHGYMAGPETLEIIDGRSYEIIRKIVLPATLFKYGNSGFSDGVFDEARRVLYLCGFVSVYKIGMDSNEFLGSLDLNDAYASRGGRGWSPTGLCGIALSPSADRLFVEAGDAHTIYTYDLVRSAWLPIFLNVRGYFPTAAATSADGRYFFSVNQKSDSVTMVDLDALAMKRIIDLSAFKVVYPPSGAAGKRVISRSLSQSGEAIDMLSWQASSSNGSSAGFRVYELNGSAKTLIADLPMSAPKYTRRGAPKGATSTYLILEVDEDGTEGVPVKVTVK